MKNLQSLCLNFCAAILIPLSLHGGNEDLFASLEEEYTPNYCLQLEAAYGDGMMSEGGIEGIEYMFSTTPLENKSALDIGSGLGGVAFYLAEKYHMQVIGLEVNAWMVEEAKKRTPEILKTKVNFLLSSSNSHWPLPDESFDIIYSKGVLTHLESKDGVFQECHRLLKEGGVIVITDWLSSEEKKWGENISRLIELENLALYPESESGYIELLNKNGYTLLSVRDDSLVYYNYNKEIAQRLRDPVGRKLLFAYFDEAELDASISGYEAIANALSVGELRVLRFIAKKLR